MHNHEFDQCMRRIQKGDKTGLKEIYEGYVSYIYAVILGIVRNRENAEDLTADFFIRLWDRADGYKPGGGHKIWMTTIARNMAIDFLIKSGRQQLMDETDEESPASGTSVENEVIGRMSFKEAVARLSEGERQIVTMKLAGDMTFKEIAAVLGLPMGTVTWKYQNSMKKLRRAGI